MTTLKKLINSVIILAVCAALTLSLFAPSATADTNSGLRRLTLETGSKHYQNSQLLVHEKTFNSVVVSLNPPNQTGMIKEIKITRAIGNNQQETEFECANQQVQNGTDLIKSCSMNGSATLKTGDTTYMADVSGFEPNTLLQVDFN